MVTRSKFYSKFQYLLFKLVVSLCVCVFEIDTSVHFSVYGRLLLAAEIWVLYCLKMCTLKYVLCNFGQNIVLALYG